MKKTPLAIVSLIIIGVSMVFAFAGIRQDELPQNANEPERIAAPMPDSVAVQVAANDAALAVLIAPMDTQADILIDEIPLMLSADRPAPEVLPTVQPVVDNSLSDILTAAPSDSDARAGAPADPNRSAQEALADMLVALDRLSQQAELARESIALLVSQNQE